MTRISIALLLASLCLVVAPITTDAFAPSFGHQPSPSFGVVNRPNALLRQQHQQHSRTTRLFLAKKKATATTTSNKLQVKLLKPVPGTGQKGDVVQVTPAFYQNKLQPARAAELISDEQVQKERAIQQAKLDATNAQAKQLQERLEADGFQLVLTRKSGPEGQLFGGIGAKALLTELQNKVQDDFVKDIKLKAVMDADQTPIKGDVKHTGTFFAELELTKEITAKIQVIVQAE